MTTYSRDTLTVDVDCATQYATVYRGETPIATIIRKRTYERTLFTWRAYWTDGSEACTGISGDNIDLLLGRIARRLADRERTATAVANYR